MDWLNQISPDTIIVLGTALLGWLGITKSKSKKTDLRKVVMAELRSIFRAEVLKHPELHSRAHEFLEARVWGFLQGKVKKTPAREALVDELISELLSQQGAAMIKVALDELFRVTRKVDVNQVSGEIPKLNIPTEFVTEMPKPDLDTSDTNPRK